MKLLLIGPPSWGSGSHRVRVRERYPLLCYANANELLRNEIQAKTPFGVDAQAQIRQGNPVSDDQLMSLVLRYLKTPACSMGFILEGMPRSPEQAERLVEEQRRIDAVVEVDVPDEECVKRMSGRLVHRPSGRIYHEHFAPPRVAGKDDVTGEALTKRLDDDPAVAKEKLKTYRKSVDAVKRYFQGQEPFPNALDLVTDDNSKKAVEVISNNNANTNNTAASATTAGSKNAADEQKNTTASDTNTAAANIDNNNNKGASGSTAATTAATATTTTTISPLTKRVWKFPSRLPVFREVSGKGPTEEVRSRLFATLDELVGKRATGPHQQRFWWSWFS